MLSVPFYLECFLKEYNYFKCRLVTISTAGGRQRDREGDRQTAALSVISAYGRLKGMLDFPLCKGRYGEDVCCKYGLSAESSKEHCLVMCHKYCMLQSVYTKGLSFITGFFSFNLA